MREDLQEAMTKLQGVYELIDAVDSDRQPSYHLYAEETNLLNRITNILRDMGYAQ